MAQLPISRYTPEIIEFGKATRAKAVYCFVIEGAKGTGGMPIVMGFPPAEEYRTLCEAMIKMMRRSADMLQADINRQVPEECVTSHTSRSMSVRGECKNCHKDRYCIKETGMCKTCMTGTLLDK